MADLSGQIPTPIGGGGQQAPAVARPSGPAPVYIRAVPVGSNALSGGLTPGLMISFEYLFFHHDPRPLVLTCRYVAKYGPNIAENLVAGFNIHYLPFNIIRALIRGFTNDPSGTVLAGLKHPGVKLTYRTYKIKGMMSARRVDWRAFMQRVAIMRQFTPAEREALIRSVEMQLTSDPRNLTAVNRIVADMVSRKMAAPPNPLPVQSPPGTPGATP